jgi:hypothetical protein
VIIETPPFKNIVRCGDYRPFIRRSILITNAW